MQELVKQCLKLNQYFNNHFPAQAFENFKKLSLRELDPKEFPTACAQAVLLFTSFIILFPEIKIPVMLYDLFCCDRTFIHEEVQNIVLLIENVVEQNKEKFLKKDFIYFYEDFLKNYDKAEKNTLGVYYTPEPIVNFIIRGVNDILKKDFECQDGLANQNIELLDFAAGTGAFFKQAFKTALEEIETPTKGHIEQLINNFSAYEYSIAPFVVSHLIMHKFIQESGYFLEEEQKFNMLLNNTLDEYAKQKLDGYAKQNT